MSLTERLSIQVVPASGPPSTTPVVRRCPSFRGALLATQTCHSWPSDAGALDRGSVQSFDSFVDSGYGHLEEVLLASPQHLSLVPCNAMSVAAMENGHRSCTDRAHAQHSALSAALAASGVSIRMVPPVARLPDLAFTRDSTFMTPWGLLGLRPGAAHRQAEVDVVLQAAQGFGIHVLGTVSNGRVEGGDICLLRPGHLAIGVSGERTDWTGAEAIGRVFTQGGWSVTYTPVAPDLLHLDTHFCMLERELALGCIEKLDPAFLQELARLGIEVISVHPHDLPTLGCNVLALGRRRILSTGSAPRVDEAMRRRGFEVITVTLNEFTQCGGGVHCLTAPLRRRPG